MKTKWEIPRPRENREVDMNSKEVMQFTQRLKYVGTTELSSTQLRKARREEVERFFKAAVNYPGWEARIEEIWDYHGDRGGNWKLETLPGGTPKKE